MSINTRLIDLVMNLDAPRIAVVGDLILDAYLEGRTERISPEAPIQVLDVEEERRAPGGAANVAVNLRNLGAEVVLCGLLGKDRDGSLLKEMVEELGIETSAVFTEEGRPTTTKVRVVAAKQQLVRIDREVRTPPSTALENRLADAVSAAASAVDAVVLSDYAKGVLTSSVIRAACEAAPDRVLVDPKGRAYDRYRGCRLITPNRREAEEATGMTLGEEEHCLRAAEAILRTTNAREVVITLGADGIFYAERSGGHNRIPAHARSVYDVTGAGDTVAALLTLCLAQGIPLDDAVRVANAGAALVVARAGVSAPTREELVTFFSFGATRHMDKILTPEAAAESAAFHRRRGERLVFTNGCFDLIHGGHVDFLRTAKGFGDVLMVGLNDDGSVRRLKGPGRPVLPLEERMEILASFQFVDYIVSFSEDDPERLIQRITPEILVKGEDWKEKGVVGREWVEAHGGRVHLVPFRRGTSTTGVIERVLERYGGRSK